MTHRKVEDGDCAPSDVSRPGDATAHVRALVRLLVVASTMADDASRLTNEAAVDALARRIVAAAKVGDTGPRTAVMALRDLVWRVDTARVLIEPRLVEAGSPELAELLATDDIHALLREIS